MEKSSFATKVGLAEMLRGGVIMDVVDVNQARIAEDAGAAAVMALERVPAQIRKEGGVARASDPAMIQAIQAAVSIPVMAKCRIGHFMEARILEALESTSSTRARSSRQPTRSSTSTSTPSPCPSCAAAATSARPCAAWARVPRSYAPRARRVPATSWRASGTFGPSAPPSAASSPASPRSS